MKVDLRYVESRRNASGALRWYWIRKGFMTERLSDDPAERYGQAERLNAKADGKDEHELDGDQTMGGVIDEYQGTARFLSTTRGTQKTYLRWLKRIRERWGNDHPEMLTRFEVVNFIEGLKDRPSTQHLAASVLASVLDRALYRGLVQQNFARGVHLAPTASRSEYWQPEQITAWLDAAAEHKRATPMRLAFLLLTYTAQRPNDVLQMTWNKFDNDMIKLRQKKTGRLVWVPCHKTLRERLLAAARTSTRIVPFLGTPKHVYKTFNIAYREICQGAGITDVQARDLRRTAVVNMSEAGCTLQQVSTITGHSIERTQRIIDTYFVRTMPQAREAIRLWEAHDSNKERV